MILPFTYDIPINTFNHHVALLGSLLTEKNAISIVYNTFINLRMRPDDYNYMAPMGFDRIAKNFDIMFHLTAYYDFTKNITKETFIRINKELIDDGFYVVGFWDEFYVDVCYSFRKYHFFHNYVMYGYDDLYFYFASYTQNEKPEEIKLSYDDFFEAAEKKDLTPYALRKYHRDYQEKLDPIYSP